MNRKRTMALVMILISMLGFSFRIQRVEASGTIYIRADGSIDPSEAPISTLDNVTYALTGNITSDADGIVVERNSIMVDGQDYTLQGTGSGTGITLSGRSNVTIKNTEITTFDYGIELDSSSNITISGNRIANNTQGIWLDGSSNNNTILRNNITANKRAGIELYSSSITIVGNDITTNDGVGILGVVSNSTVSGNNITGNSDRGIYIESSLNNNISGNNVAANKRDGIFLFYYSNYNSINGNTITNDGISIIGGSGIYFYESSNNSIFGNTIINNSNGIKLDESSNNNTILRNNITANSNYGIYFEDSSNNSIYHNNFVNNAHQVYDFWAIFGGPFSINAWDDGYPSGGNYWSDYNGADADHDGIGDTAYVIDANNTDNYPLMVPTVIPEFSSFPILPLFFIATLLTVVIYRRRHAQNE